VHAGELCEQEGIHPAPYVGRYKWVLLERLNVLSDEEIEELIRQSHQMVVQRRKAKVKSRKPRSKSKTLNHKGHKKRKNCRPRGLRVDRELLRQI
jgi:hypothetical protein